MPFTWSGLARSQRFTTLDPKRAANVERTLSIARVVVVTMGFVGTLLGGSEPKAFALAVVMSLAAYLAFSAAFAAYAHFRVVDQRWALGVHLVDIALIAVVTSLTGGPASPLFAIYVFVLLASAFRWGQRETVLTGFVIVCTLLAQALLYLALGFREAFAPSLVLIRAGYFGIGSVLFGALAETERRSGRISQAVTRVMSRVRAEAGVVGSVQAVLDEFLDQFAASRAVLVLDEEGNDRVFIWQGDAASSPAHRVRLSQERRADALCYTFRVPEGVDAWYVVRPAPLSGGAADMVVALDAGGHRTSVPLDLSALESAPVSWRRMVGVDSMAGEGWTGRLFIFDPVIDGRPDDHLVFLQSLARGVGPALFNLYLQRRLASRTGVVDRARISRELHDGVIQSLVGIEMQLEVIRRESGGRVPESLVTQLTTIQGLLSQEILNVRDLMQLLRPVEVDARRLVEHLADLLDRFRHRTGIDARLVCNADEIDLPPRVCRELSAVVQEALANVRKHSGASDVLVRLEVQGSCWRLEIDDNGKGFDFDGHFEHEELDALRRGPVVIKERVRALGGRLAIHSQPGFGSRLEISIPRKRHV